MPILLDTQLVVLLVVGVTSTRIISKHRNLSAFTDADFDLLLQLIGPVPRLVLLPNVISEASNLLRQHKDPERSSIARTLGTMVLAHQEHYVPSVRAVARTEYLRLGVADAAILDACTDVGCELLTADYDLFGAATRAGLRATNFNHWREDLGLL